MCLYLRWKGSKNMRLHMWKIGREVLKLWWFIEESPWGSSFLLFLQFKLWGILAQRQWSISFSMGVSDRMPRIHWWHWSTILTRKEAYSCGGHVYRKAKQVVDVLAKFSFSVNRDGRIFYSLPSFLPTFVVADIASVSFPPSF